MNRFRRAAIRCLFCSLVLLPAAARAWNPSGHMIIALIAYDELDPATRTKALELLKKHPRFAEHFQGAMPREVQKQSDADKDQWYFAHAAAWPDQVRDAKFGVTHQDVTQYNRPIWHYIDEPLFLNENEQKQLLSTVRVNRRREPPEDKDDTFMNVIQALKNSARIIRDPSMSDEKRAVHLCWIMHLTGDSHQPLHSSALFTSHRFPGGDHGGNFLAIEHGWDLHAFWDEQITNDEPFETLRLEATDLNQNRKLQAAGKQAAATLDPGKWIDESAEIAKQSVYTKEVLKKVADREGHSYLGPLDLPPSYKANAADVAERRAVEAGYRLAAAIKQMLQ
jgi:hypothetical protein